MKIKTGVKCPCCGEWAIVLYDTDTENISEMISGKSRLPEDIIAHKMEGSEKDLKAEAFFADSDSKVKNFSLAVVGFQLIIGFLGFIIWQVFVQANMPSGQIGLPPNEVVYPDTNILQLSLYGTVILFGVNLLATGVTVVSSYFHKKKYKYEQLSEKESLLERVSVILVIVNAVIFSVGFMALIVEIVSIIEGLSFMNVY